MPLHKTLIEASLAIDTEACEKVLGRPEIPDETRRLLRTLIERTEEARRLIARIDGGSLLLESAQKEIDGATQGLLAALEAVSAPLQDAYAGLQGIAASTALN